ncbi:MAG: tRNA (adenosine(37)-N6)-dimethylallyltransferase MiaA [Treponema sp.]|jgi:tRNA dimethylallyltransferase|nr:tRNA (adenosine(37)-N6)-dimethylallyltransferase MiaA [Treponema sp.]
MENGRFSGGYNCLVLLGPTAAGKTALAVRLAHVLNAEIISADSRQVYQGLDIGSGKDLQEYFLLDEAGQENFVPVHLIDITDLTQEYSAFAFLRDAYKAFADITGRGGLPLLTGGTGMYVDAFVRGYQFSGLSTPLTRPDIRPLVMGTTLPRHQLHKNIVKRLRSRFKEGMTEEVTALHEQGVSWERLERLGLEYRFIAEFLQGKIETQTALFRALTHAINQFAKRQETWFRGMERKGVVIHWIPPGTVEERFAWARDFVREL